MNDEDKTKAQLIAELVAARQRIAALEHLEPKSHSSEILRSVRLPDAGQKSDEQPQTEAELREVETIYRSLVEQLPSLTYIIDHTAEEGRTQIYVSPQIEQLLGFTPEEWLAGQNLWHNQLHPEDRERVLAEVKRRNTAREPLDFEYRMLARDGRVVWVRNKTTLIQDKTGQPHRSHGMIVDITEQKHLEEQLRQAQRLEAVGEMAGGVAHNFNNVLTAVIGHAELAVQALASDHPVQQDLRSIRKSAQRAAKLTHQLLAFTRHQVVNSRKTDLNSLILNLDVMIRQLITEAIKFELILTPNISPIKVDPNQIEQLLVNLVVNARDAMPRGGQLTIETADVNFGVDDTCQHAEIRAGDYVMMSVGDTGVGMTDEVKAHIFEPFFSTKEIGQGTGLGLSTCYGIIRQNGGYILVDSALEQGTTFKIYLPPLEESKPDADPEREGVKQLSTAGTETILIVEDAVMVREMTVRVLRKQGYRVLDAVNGAEALQLLQAQPDVKVQLLITDIIMPEMGGEILATRMTATYPELKVIFISGYSDRAMARQGIVQKATAVLPKPFTPDALIHKVRMVLDGIDE